MRHRIRIELICHVINFITSTISSPPPKFYPDDTKKGFNYLLSAELFHAFAITLENSIRPPDPINKSFAEMYDF